MAFLDFFLKTLPLLVEPLTTIFNESFLSAKLPIDRKHVIITSLYKDNGNSNEITYYRSTNCTSITGKVFESLVKRCLLSHLLEAVQKVHTYKGGGKRFSIL